MLNIRLMAAVLVLVGTVLDEALSSNRDRRRSSRVRRLLLLYQVCRLVACDARFGSFPRVEYRCVW
jgi:hypothetical protein